MIRSSICLSLQGKMVSIMSNGHPGWRDTRRGGEIEQLRQDGHLTENAEPLSLHHNDTLPSVNPVGSVRDILKGGWYVT